MQVLAGGGDLLWVVIVVGSMIAQVINAKKKAADKKKTAGRPQQRSQPPPNDELRDFLATLSGIPKPAPAATPPRLPTSAAVKHRPPPPKPSHRKKPEVVLTAVEQQPDEIKLQVEDKKPQGLAALIKEDLQNMNSTRKAIVLREILGPPIALKKQMTY